MSPTIEKSSTKNNDRLRIEEISCKQLENVVQKMLMQINESSF